MIANKKYVKSYFRPKDSDFCTAFFPNLSIFLNLLFLQIQFNGQNNGVIYIYVFR